MKDFLFSLPEYVKVYTAVLTIFGVFIRLIIYLQRRKQRIKFETDLSHFFENYDDAKKYRKNYIPTMGTDRPPENEDEPIDSIGKSYRFQLIKFFIKEVFPERSKHQFLILGGAGMGKTTFMINLFYKYNYKVGINKKRIRYIPLGDPRADEFINKYKNDGSFYKDGGNTILLLDAFDEDPKAADNHVERINELVKLTSTFHKVLISSRSQFFPDEESAKYSYALPNIDKSLKERNLIHKYIAPFSDNEVKKFLRNKYGIKIGGYYKNPDRKIAEGICEKSSFLIARPMLLDNIDELIKSKKRFNFEHEVYEELINSWIQRESKKQPQRRSETFTADMQKFVDKAAKNVYSNFLNQKGLFVEYDVLTQVANDNNINLDLVDLTTRSLLNRNTKGRVKFSHKSILEYLLARIDSKSFATSNLVDLKHFDFGKRVRNQIIFNQIIDSDYQFVFPFYKNDGNNAVYNTLASSEFNAINKIEEVIAFNFKELEMRKLRIFSNLKVIYSIRIDLDVVKKSTSKIISNHKDFSVNKTPNFYPSMALYESGNLAYELKFVSKRNTNDEYFNAKNIIVEDISYNLITD